MPLTTSNPKIIDGATYFDYYILRVREYPFIGEQMNAMWKGEETAQTMINTQRNTI